MTMFQEVIYALALALVGVIAFALRELITLGIAYLKSKIGETNYKNLREYAQITVKALEQTPAYKDFDGGKKKELAKVAVVQWAQKHGLPIDDALFDKFIEAAVQEMNSQMSSIDWVAGEIMSSDDPGLVGSSN